MGSETKRTEGLSPNRSLPVKKARKCQEISFSDLTISEMGNNTVAKKRGKKSRWCHSYDFIISLSVESSLSFVSLFLRRFFLLREV